MTAASPDDMQELIERLRAETTEERREEILSKGWDTAVKSLYDEIKRTGEHGDYQRLIFESWIIDGKDELLEEAATNLAALTARNAVLEKALEPFAAEADRIHPDWANERRRATLTASKELTVADFRRARAALSPIPAEPR